jgi:NAD(P)-dependent dehydrogenase (short-subunit alcohol dehydrogenase family)
MRVFLTGATGYIGSAVLDALVRGGHDVTALVRDNEKARRVAKRTAHPIIGNLAEPDSYRGGAQAQDGYVHTAFDTTSGKGTAVERAALETIIAAAMRPRTGGSTMPMNHEDLVLDAGSDGLRTVVVRPGVAVGCGLEEVADHSPASASPVAEQNGPVRRCTGPRSAGPQPPRSRARVDANAPFRCRKRCEAAQGMARFAELGPKTFTLSSCRFA